MIHCMLDLETFGTKPGCVIRSIGAVQFDPHVNIDGQFYQNITEEDQLEIGLVKDVDSVLWWSKQSSEAQSSLLTDQKSLKQTMEEFHAWFKDNKLKYLWSQGSNFDGVLWEHAADLLGLTVPWKYSNTRDTRTLYDAAEFNPWWMKRQGTYHNALDDAIHQCRCVYKSYRMIRQAK